MAKGARAFQLPINERKRSVLVGTKSTTGLVMMMMRMVMMMMMMLMIGL